uniref:NADH-ubiquinone oxidoreductase chain 6 n=1 Tax=Staphylinidae sp. BMNH 1274674 TaxID=1796592 RepID=A0A126TG27_9COLE|nr:NADH dehydrogenase subunit 6 [Staphylinidae sp. BMNH 1274674]
MIFLLMLNCMMALIFIMMNHPMTLGVILLIQTIMISMITGQLTMNFWFSYILFLIMIGGMLVIFIYMTSIASNESFNFSNTLFFIMLILFIFFIMSISLFDNFYIFMISNLSETLFIKNNNFNLMKYFNYPPMIMILMMMIYLFITLIAIVKITLIEYGPLRQKF